MQKRAKYRATREPTTAVPFGTRSVGHYIVDSEFQERPCLKHFIQLFWGIEGSGNFFINGKSCLLSPGQVCFYLPGDEHCIQANSPEWNYRWLTIDGDLNTKIFGGFAFSKFPKDAGPCPEDLFLKLEREILDHTPRGQCLASATAYSILALACGGSRNVDSEPSLPEKCIKLIEQNFSDPQFDVNKLSEIMRINRSQISRMFREKMHITLKEYIVACRLQKAMSIIKETSLPIATIAEKCGYNSADYFAKAIRKATGFNPLEFRKQ